MSLVNITIDGHALQVEAGTNLIEAAKKLGTMIPHYCYHPGLRADGNCRMCLVQVEKMPKPVIGCRTGATEGMVVHTNTPEVKKIRENVMEFLLVNHPLDCPTCDQAGECRLQDYYMDYDVKSSRFQEEKVHKDKMVDLGAGVMLDEERCIVCTRCVRFCQDVAKNEELYVQARGNHSMVATFPGKKMTNPYAGNTVDVCPVGALTSKDFRYKKRVWFLSHVDSVCMGCSRGCNTSVHHADNKVFRLKPRFNADVNQYWMCDAGRYDYQYINDNRRLRAVSRQNGQLVESDTTTVLADLVKNLSQYRQSELAFIASARESNEEIDAFVQMAQNLFDAQTLYYTKNDPANPYEDDILIKADKNPNLFHITKLGLSSLQHITAQTKAVIVQRELSEADLATLKKLNIKVLAVFATNNGIWDADAEFILPLPTFAEQNGHVTNFEGKVQLFKQALRVKGDAMLMSQYAKSLKSALSRKREAV